MEVLVNELACMPLAIKLMASLAREEDIDRLLQDYQVRGTEIARSSGRGRLQSLDDSIVLSVESPRVRENPHAPAVLAALALVPDGMSDMICSMLAKHVPDMDIYGALAILKHVALIYVDSALDGAPLRYQMLPPIRRWCRRKLPPSDHLQNALVNIYVALSIDFGDTTDIEHHRVIIPELLNIEAIILHGCDTGCIHENLSQAAVRHSKWSLLLGNPSSKLLSVVAQNVQGLPRANCLRMLGKTCRRNRQFTEGEQALFTARQLHKDEGTLEERLMTFCSWAYCILNF
jgi:hypothetical protein